MASHKIEIHILLEKSFAQPELTHQTQEQDAHIVVAFDIVAGFALLVVPAVDIDIAVALVVFDIALEKLEHSVVALEVVDILALDNTYWALDNIRHNIAQRKRRRQGSATSAPGQLHGFIYTRSDC